MLGSLLLRRSFRSPSPAHSVLVIKVPLGRFLQVTRTNSYFEEKENSNGFILVWKKKERGQFSLLFYDKQRPLLDVACINKKNHNNNKSLIKTLHLPLQWSLTVIDKNLATPQAAQLSTTVPINKEGDPGPDQSFIGPVNRWAPRLGGRPPFINRYRTPWRGYHGEEGRKRKTSPLARR